jgi:HK97 family phage prohead protease
MTDDRREVVLYEAVLEPVPDAGPLRYLEGRALPYEVWTNRGWYMESVAYGALDKSIDESAGGLPLLLFHDDRTWPIGVSEDWDSRKDGLHGKWRIDEDEQAQRAARLARDGMLRYFSVGIVPIRSDWDYVEDAEWKPSLGPEHMDKVTRTEARLLETSLVTTPAFSQAQVKLVHSSTKPPANRDRRPVLRAWQEWRASLPDPVPAREA